VIDLEPAARRMIGLVTSTSEDAAWGELDAWVGVTYAGRLEMPAGAVGLVALDELVVHGWDLAVATGQPYEATTEEVEGAMSFVTWFDAPRDGTIFGPIVPVADRSNQLDHLLGLTGRDPHWRPPA
jgi:uncharacterized protein (TIGR03086 family)